MRHVLRLAVALVAAAAEAQQPAQPIGVPVPPLGSGPLVFDTAEQHKIRVSILARGLSHPWGMTFLPDGSMLVTERPGRLRMVRKGKLDPTPIAGVPKVYAVQLAGLMDVALDPAFGTNHLIYLTYNKPSPDGKQVATALARSARYFRRRLVAGERERIQFTHGLRPRRHDLRERRCVQ